MPKKSKKNGHKPQKSKQRLNDLNVTAYRASTVPVREHNFGGEAQRKAAGPKNGDAPVRTNRYGIPDWRLEVPDFKLCQTTKDGEVCWEVTGKLDTPAPPIRESKYLSREQSIEIYRWMHLNRRMETALENLYKQGKVVGGVYFGLGQEACSCA